jgi:rfaE bifunctional protein nucleotidyltransferase chain/domain
MIFNSENELCELRNVFKEKTIILCHGCFDVFHYGHLHYLKSSKRLGDILVVSITNDLYIGKGSNRPIFDIKKRINIIDELKCVDYCCISNDFTSISIIKSLKPNIYSKGMDVSGKELDVNENLFYENQTLSLVGGKLVFIDIIPSIGSTNIINLCMFK